MSFCARSEALCPNDATIPVLRASSRIALCIATRPRCAVGVGESTTQALNAASVRESAPKNERARSAGVQRARPEDRRGGGVDMNSVLWRLENELNPARRH